ncbi:MAG: hypothetical protein GY788_07940 [bacterium]|nr:hypothetical protein [bacterium]
MAQPRAHSMITYSGILAALDLPGDRVSGQPAPPRSESLPPRNEWTFTPMHHGDV